METEDDFGAGRFFEAHPLRANGHAAIGADFDESAEAPNKGPPRATGRWAQDGAFGAPSAVPGLLRGHPQFAMDLAGVVMKAQLVDVRVGLREVGDVFAGKKRGEAALPELVLALDFSLGLRRWGIQKTNVVKLEGGAELGEGVGMFDKKDGVIIDVDLEWAAVSQERGGQKIEIGEKQFPVINFGPDKHPAAIIEHVEHGKIQRATGEPLMG